MTRSAAATRTGKKWYFEHLDIQGIRCNLTLIPKSGQTQELALQRARLTTAFGIRFMDIHGVPLRISALQMRNAFVTWRMLVSQIYRHLFFQVTPTASPGKRCMLAALSGLQAHVSTCPRTCSRSSVCTACEKDL